MSRAPYTVMASIHGPSGYHDVVETVTGSTVAVCPRRVHARRIANLLSEHFGCAVPAKKSKVKK